jgi:hypothetical protein
LATYLDLKGYLRVCLWTDNKRHGLRVHSAVAEAFHGPRENNLVVNHLDGNKLNNKAENLEYVTNEENHAHASALGLKRSKVPDSLVATIVSLSIKGISLNKIAKELRIGRDTVNRALRRAIPKPIITAPDESRTTYFIPPYPVLSQQEWRPVVGYEGLYEISNYGMLRRCDKLSRFYSKGRTRKWSVGETGYMRTALCENGKVRYVSAHQTVAAAFLGPCPEGMQVDHKDGNKFNNKPENLQYASPKDNTRRHIASNLTTIGRAHRHSKLTIDDVTEIRRLSSEGVSRAEIGRKYNVLSGYISAIVLGNKWKEEYV